MGYDPDYMLHNFCFELELMLHIPVNNFSVILGLSVSLED